MLLLFTLLSAIVTLEAAFLFFMVIIVFGADMAFTWHSILSVMSSLYFINMFTVWSVQWIYDVFNLGDKWWK